VKITQRLEFYAKGNASWAVNNGQCYRSESCSLGCPDILTGGFDNLFGWARTAVESGQDMFQNRTCRLWKDARLVRTLCLDGDLPVYLDFLQRFFNFSSITRIVFGPDYVRTAKAEEPASCPGPPPACGSGEVETMKLYLFHPVGMFNISQQDIANAQGDAVYVCADFLWKVEDYKLGSVYEVDVFQKFGQYANCNGYVNPVCFAGDGFHVGREAPVGAGRRAGQCDDDLYWRQLFGTWYSLPQGGLCQHAGQKMGQDCTWRVRRRVKTVSMSCMFNKRHGLLKQCATATAPFKGITATFTRAFESDSPAKGGCPAVDPETGLPQGAAEAYV